jgi:hypothetical protein
VADVLSTGGAANYAPTVEPVTNKYAGVPGILEVRKGLDANGWQNRPIIDTEHIDYAFSSFETDVGDELEAALMVQESILERTLRTAAGSPALYGVTELKIGPHGTIGELLCASLYSDGSMSKNVKAVGLLWEKLRAYHYAGHMSGQFDTARIDGSTVSESQAWVEKFTSATGELYVFFKPFTYTSLQSARFDGQTVSYSLDLGRVPSSIMLTDVYGNANSVAAAQVVMLSAQNAPKYLEVVY